MPTPYAMMPSIDVYLWQIVFSFDPVPSTDPFTKLIATPIATDVICSSRISARDQRDASCPRR